MTHNPQITVVEASAGSGKTYSLSKHYVRLLMHDYKESGPGAFAGVLAVTFTNKASFEMKQRILKMLKCAEFGAFRNDKEEKELLSYWGVDRETAKKVAAAFLDAIMANYSRFQVRTIDSFINNVIMACSFNLDLPSHFDVEHDFEPYLAKALDSLIDDADDDERIRSKFAAFLDRLLNVEQKVNWYPRRDILETIKSLYSEAATYGGEFEVSGMSHSAIHVKRKEFKKIIEELAGKIPEGTHANLRKGIEKAVVLSAGPGLNIGDLSKYFQKDEYQVTSKHKVPANVEALWKKIRKTLRDICETESYTQFDSYVDIYNLMAGRFLELSRRDRVIFLPELNRIASGIFEQAGMFVPEIYFRLASRIRHYLLDEFQDTNDLQWSNFRSLIDEAVSSGGSFFYVGDKKQSIYRFRGANSALFDEVKEGFEGYRVEVQELDQNWRSAPEVVGFNNGIFSKDNLDVFLEPFEDDTPGLGDAVHKVFSNAHQKAVNSTLCGSVRVEHIDDADEEAEEIILARTVDEVKKLSGVHGASGVCVLCRDNSEVEDVSARLIEHGVAVQSEKTLNIKENPLIKELVSLLKFLSSPVDDAAFASFITGRMFQKASSLGSDDIAGFLFECRSDSRQGSSPLYKKFKEKFASRWDAYLDHLMGTSGFVPLYEYVIRILNNYNAAANFPEDHAYFMKFLDMISENEDKLPTISGFVEYFDGARSGTHVSAAGSDSVKVMTVHKAKGLEFGAVVIPFLRMEPRIGGPRKKAYVIEKNGRALNLVRLKEEYCGYSEKLNKLYDAEYIKSFCDELNNVYVALTRAVSDLVVFVPPKSGRSRNIVRGLVAATIVQGTDRRGESRLASACIKTDIAERSDILHIQPNKLGDPIDYIKGDDFTEKAVSNRASRVLGIIAHHLLSGIKDLSTPLTGDMEDAARKLFPYTDISVPAKWVRKLLKDKKMSVFFDPADTAFTEKEIVTSKGEMNRIDRLIIKKDEVWVIDYKSSDEMIRDHAAQVKRYESALKQIFNRSKVRGFLIYFDACRYEEVNG